MQLGNPSYTGANPAQNGLIKESDTANFVADVIEASVETPILVDFWAPWCGPCKQLTPILEKVVAGAGGKLKLVKINLDENKELAMQLRVQSIPAVFAFKDRRPVDGFMGALPESQVKAFVERLLGGAIGPSPVDMALEDAQGAFEAKDYASAAQIYAAVLAQEQSNLTAIAGLAECYLATGDAERAEETLALVPPDKANDPAIASAKAKLELAGQKAEPEEVTHLVARLDTDPNDHEARFDLALALNAAGERESAVTELLEIIRRDRKWNDEAARKQLLTLFEAYGPTDEVTLDGRRKLSSILFS